MLFEKMRFFPIILKYLINDFDIVTILHKDFVSKD